MKITERSLWGLHGSRRLDRLDDVTELFGKETEEVQLGFVPSEADGYEASKLRE